MHGDYQPTVGIQTAGITLAGADTHRALDALQHLGNRLEVVNDKLVGFISRFQGAEGLGNPSTMAPVPSGYAGQIARLETVIEQIENQVTFMGGIG